MLKSNLKVIFAQKNIKASEVAKALNTTEGVVSKWVTNKNTPTAKTLFELAHLLDVKVDDLYTYQKDEK